jgi:predicted alpha-1,2-mannosidase
MYKISTVILLLLLISTLSLARSLVNYVDPFNGTSKSRRMLYPGPSMPFGMVKLSPDSQGNAWCGGYEYTIGSISGFSHIHSWAMGGLSVMPVVGSLKTYQGEVDSPTGYLWTAGYLSRFLKETEKASVGYYSVELMDCNVKVELTSTSRAGMMRLTYPESEQSYIIFDFLFPIEDNFKALKAEARKVSNQEIEGYIEQYGDYAKEYTVHFVARFNKPFVSMGSWQAHDYTGDDPRYGDDWKKERDIKQDIEAFTGEDDCGVFVRFKTENDEQILVQAGISLVSIEQARLNLKTEMDPFEWNFDKVVQNARNTWNKLLGKIEVKGGSDIDRKKFYTILYRTYCVRTIWSDVNGKYTDMFEKTRQIHPPADAVYGCDAFWVVQWNLHPLWTLMTPDIANSWVNSLLEIYDKGGWLPKGPTGIEYSSVMVASHEISLIVSAYQKGIRNFNVKKAWEAIKHVQTTPGRKHESGGHVGNRNLASYMELGYVPDEEGPVSTTMEYAYDDWCVAQMAKALGKEEDYQYFIKRVQNYRNAYDAGSSYIRQKHRNGDWVQDWDPLHSHGTWYGAGYVEGTAWQYTFFVPHDVQGMIRLLGRKRFNDRLEEGFARNYVNVGNQPNMQAPFLFNFSGKPWLTQKYSRQLMNTQFSADPYIGWKGEEDQGQMSSLLVLSTMGLFQMDGGYSVKPYYEISSPLFDEVTLHLDKKYYPGESFIIRALNNSPENIYIQSARLNGKPLNKPWLYHSELVKGGVLVLHMGNEPNPNWGSDENATLPSNGK